MKSLLLTLVVAFTGTTALTYGQDLTYKISEPTQIYLGDPNYDEGTQLIPVGIDLWEGNEVNTIYYGKTPPNSENKPVLIFVHGYATNGQVFFQGKDNMYADVYKDGYRSVYVSLTPNDDMWTNGAMLANMIAKVRSHYNNAPIVMIGWSKGGVDIDAALVHYGAHRHVSEVFTLSTPHYGTGIAELANSVLLSLVNIIFMQNNDATLSLQRGYMNYFRSITDHHPNNTVPYTTIGGWGDGPLNRLSIPQGILYLMDGSKSSGGNDGVVPYASSRRPGGTELFDGLKKYYGFLWIPYYDGPDETNLDHFEVTRGNKVWPHIKTALQQNNQRQTKGNSVQPQKPNQILRSQFHWITPDSPDFYVGQNDRQTQLIPLHEIQNTIAVKGSGKSFKEFELTKSNNTDVFATLQVPPGRYQLLDPAMVALVYEEKGPEMVLDLGDQLVMTPLEDGLLDASLYFIGLENTNDIEIDARLIPISDFKLNKAGSPSQIPLDYVLLDNKFELQVNDALNSGIYQLIVEAHGPQLKRSLITTVAISMDEVSTTVSDRNEWVIYPNPASNQVTIRLSESYENTVVTIYSIRGEVVQKISIPANSKTITWNPVDVKSGIYLVELQIDNQRKQQKLLILE